MTAWRLGASDVHLVCLESRGTMPAHDSEVAQAEPSLATSILTKPFFDSYYLPEVANKCGPVG
mgnify:CR=1 FL=1